LNPEPVNGYNISMPESASDEAPLQEGKRSNAGRRVPIQGQNRKARFLYATMWYVMSRQISAAFKEFYLGWTKRSVSARHPLGDIEDQ
jgi:hypothetical protein